MCKLSDLELSRFNPTISVRDGIFNNFKPRLVFNKFDQILQPMCVNHLSI